jgi:SPP1 gp7 family putative phage head morphogenesis protein
MDPDQIVEQLGLDDGAAIAALMRRFYPLLLAVSYRDAGDVLQVDDIAFSLSNPLIQTILGELAQQVRAVAETTRQEIRELVGRQAVEGWSIDQLMSEIIGLSEIQTPARAELIAVTETAAAYSKGSIAAYRQSGVVLGMRWLAEGDACPICDPLNELLVELDEAWPGGIAHPPAHPRCRCAIAPFVG